MEHFGLVIRRLRESKGLPLREVSTALDIDQAVISKLERRQRSATSEQVARLAAFFQVPLDELMTHWLSDKVALLLKGHETALEALDMAREKVVSEAREDFSRESVFHQVYQVCRKTAFSRIWVYGPFAEGRNILSRNLFVLVESRDAELMQPNQLLAFQEKLRKATRMKVDCIIKDSGATDGQSQENKILIWEIQPEKQASPVS